METKCRSRFTEFRAAFSRVLSLTSRDHVKPNTLKIAVLTGVLATVVYLATPTADYYWDGITFALQIERVAKGDRGAELLFHQNHLLYNAIGFVLYRATQAAGVAVRAIHVLQITNAFVGGLAVAVFFRLVDRATRSRYVAVVCSAALAGSAAWWKISTDADAYILTYLLILVCAANLIGERPRVAIAGLALAGAMLVHEMASLFFPAALVAIFCNRGIEHRASFAARMTLFAVTPAIAGYYLCAVLLHGYTRPLDVLGWVTSNPSQKHLSASPADGLAAFPRATFDAIVGHTFSVFRSKAGWMEATLALAAGITLIVAGFTIARRVDLGRAFRTIRQWAAWTNETNRRIAPMLIGWFSIYIVFFLFWGPLIYFRAAYTPAIMLGLGLALASYHRVTGARPSGAAAFAVVAFALFNLAFYIGPNMHLDANVVVAAAEVADRRWDEKTVILFADHNEADTAFEYFNEDVRWKRLTRTSVNVLKNEVHRVYQEGGEVWLNKGAIEIVGDKNMEPYETGDEITVDAPNGSARYLQLIPIQ
jgi:hypothetical protein